MDVVHPKKKFQKSNFLLNFDHFTLAMRFSCFQQIVQMSLYITDASANFFTLLAKLNYFTLLAGACIKAGVRREMSHCELCRLLCEVESSIDREFANRRPKSKMSQKSASIQQTEASSKGASSSQKTPTDESQKSVSMQQASTMNKTAKVDEGGYSVSIAPSRCDVSTIDMDKSEAFTNTVMAG